jgi:hypothetical protein
MSAAPKLSESEHINAAADTAIATCGGDMRNTICALIVANEFLERELGKASIAGLFARHETRANKCYNG